jgi:hypothetical protein
LAQSVISLPRRNPVAFGAKPTRLGRDSQSGFMTSRPN